VTKHRSFVVLWLALCLAVIGGTCSSADAQQVVLSVKEQQALKALMGPTATIEQLLITESTGQPLSSSGIARIYVDSGTHLLMCSINGGSYAACLGSGGGVTTFGGAAGAITLTSDSNVTLTMVGNALTAGWSGTLLAARFPILTGDVTTPGGSLATTLAASGVTADTYGDASHVAQITVDAKGRITAASNVAIPAALTGSGAATRCAFWTGASALSSDSACNWDNTNKRLGIGGTPTAFLHVLETISAPQATTQILAKIAPTVSGSRKTNPVVVPYGFSNFNFYPSAGYDLCSDATTIDNPTAKVFNDTRVSSVCRMIDMQTTTAFIGPGAGFLVSFKDNSTASAAPGNERAGMGVRMTFNGTSGGWGALIDAVATSSADAGIPVIQGLGVNTGDARSGATPIAIGLGIGHNGFLGDTGTAGDTALSISADYGTTQSGDFPAGPYAEAWTTAIKLSGNSGNRFVLSNAGTVTTGVWNAGAVTSSSTVTATTTITGATVRAGTAADGIAMTSTVLKGTASSTDNFKLTATTGQILSGSSTDGTFMEPTQIYGKASGTAMFQMVTTTGQIGGFSLALTETGGGTDTVTLKAVSAITTSYTLILPNESGGNGDCLVRDAGSSHVVTLSFSASCGGGGGGITDLNGLSAASQTFVDDTNVSMVSSGSTHTITWLSTLAKTRGGWGADISGSSGLVSLNAGTVTFNTITATRIPVMAASNAITSDSDFTYDTTTDTLRVGTGVAGVFADKTQIAGLAASVATFQLNAATGQIGTTGTVLAGTAANGCYMDPNQIYCNNASVSTFQVVRSSGQVGTSNLAGTGTRVLGATSAGVLTDAITGANLQVNALGVGVANSTAGTIKTTAEIRSGTSTTYAFMDPTQLATIGSGSATFQVTASSGQVGSSNWAGTGNRLTYATAAGVMTPASGIRTDGNKLTLYNNSSITNGQLLIGNTATGTFDKNTLTGTANQVTVTVGGGTITLSTPQSIGTASSVTFGDMTAGTSTNGCYVQSTQVFCNNASVPTIQLTRSTGQLGGVTGLLQGAGQTSASFSTSGNMGGSWKLQDSGASAGNGGAIVFGASQGFYAAIKGLLANGTNNTAGDVIVATRVNTTDGTLTEQMRIAGSGAITMTTLKTTGSAGSKKVVCVDTSTGQLYASSTSTDCSN